jgi:uncharacterized membrane protein
MFLLGVSKGVEIQTLLIRAGRAIARACQWYDYRRAIQLLVLIVLLFATGAIAFGFVRRHWAFIRTHLTIAAGLGTIFFYCALRAADINHVELLGPDRSTSAFLWPMEAFGLVLMLFGSGKALASRYSAPSFEAGRGQQ